MAIIMYKNHRDGFDVKLVIKTVRLVLILINVILVKCSSLYQQPNKAVNVR